jgi:hypothetical protein
MAPEFMMDAEICFRHSVIASTEFRLFQNDFMHSLSFAFTKLLRNNFLSFKTQNGAGIQDGCRKLFSI